MIPVLVPMPTWSNIPAFYLEEITYVHELHQGQDLQEKN
jgi:hypothetical protein